MQHKILNNNTHEVYQSLARRTLYHRIETRHELQHDDPEVVHLALISLLC